MCQGLSSPSSKPSSCHPPSLRWDSVNLMDINSLLALVEDVICPQNTAGQVFWEEAEMREDPVTLTLGSSQMKVSQAQSGMEWPLEGQRLQAVSVPSAGTRGTRAAAGGVPRFPPAPQPCPGPQAAADPEGLPGGTAGHLAPCTCQQTPSRPALVVHPGGLAPGGGHQWRGSLLHHAVRPALREGQLPQVAHLHSHLLRGEHVHHPAHEVGWIGCSNHGIED
ncbi:hypothetical protein H8959_000953 [Pygathrix nigripes]